MQGKEVQVSTQPTSAAAFLAQLGTTTLPDLSDALTVYILEDGVEVPYPAKLPTEIEQIKTFSEERGSVGTYQRPSFKKDGVLYVFHTNSPEDAPYTRMYERLSRETSLRLLQSIRAFDSFGEKLSGFSAWYAAEEDRPTLWRYVEGLMRYAQDLPEDYDLPDDLATLLT